MLSVENISYSLKKNKFTGLNENVTIIDNISFTLKKGKILSISGESGSGKTTLVKLLSGIIAPTSGSIEFSSEISKENNKLQFLFQNNGELLNPFRTVEGMITDTLALYFKSDYLIKEKKEELLSLFQLNKNLLNRNGNQLSGGEQQRVALARIFAVQPQILILDEPFSAQDIESQMNLINLLKKITILFEVTLICITHDILLLPEFSDEIIILNNGKIVEMGSVKCVLNKPRHPYTKHLIDTSKFNVTFNKIDIQNSFHQIPACPFFKQCEYRKDKCAVDVVLQKNDHSDVLCNYPIH